MASVEGLLAMADISGYPTFVSGTEHEHSREILAELIENIAKSVGGKLSVDQVEGDALCCSTERPGGSHRLAARDVLDEPKGLRTKLGTIVAVRMMKKYFGEYDDRMDALLKEAAPSIDAA